MKKYLLLLVTAFISMVATSQTSKDVKRHQFVNDLMKKMTLEEKLGQLNLPASSDFVTGAVSSSDIAQKVKEGKLDFGYNARTDKYENMIAAGVIDPTKVSRIALENAASIAAMLLTTECVLADDPEDDKGAAAMGGSPGMGGMGGMM